MQFNQTNQNKGDVINDRFELLKCPVPGCGWGGDLKYFLGHVAICHAIGNMNEVATEALVRARREGAEEAYCMASKIAWEMQQRQFGGGTAIGNEIADIGIRHVRRIGGPKETTASAPGKEAQDGNEK